MKNEITITWFLLGRKMRLNMEKEMEKETYKRKMKTMKLCGIGIYRFSKITKKTDVSFRLGSFVRVCARSGCLVDFETKSRDLLFAFCLLGRRALPLPFPPPPKPPI